MSSPQGGNHNILQREQPSYPTQTGTYPDGRPILTFTAAPDMTPPTSSYNVLDFGARGDGVTDDTAAIQSAITACQGQGGGIVFLPPGTYLISSTLVISADNVQVQGAGWASIITPAAGFPAGPMLQVQAPGGGGNFRYGIRIAELFFNGNNVAGVGGLDLISTYGALVEHLRMRYLAGIAVHWDGISGAFGAYNYLRDCHITDGVGAIAAVQTDDSEWLTIQGGHIGFYQTAGATAVLLQNLNNRIIGVSFDYVDTGVKCAFAGRNHIIGCQFDRGFTRFVYLESAASCMVVGNFFGVRSGTGNEIIRADGTNNDKSVIVGNAVEATSGWPSFVTEYSGIGGVNTYADNDTGALPLTLLTGIARGNHGYNPRGASVTQLAVAATGVALTNTTGCDCMLLVGGGTITQIAIGGVNTGLTSGWFRIPAQQTVTVTYSVAPTTFQWFGD